MWGADRIMGMDIDPLLDPNGGLTQTHALLPGSVAIDAFGDCVESHDQRGWERQQLQARPCKGDDHHPVQRARIVPFADELDSPARDHGGDTCHDASRRDRPRKHSSEELRRHDENER